MRSKRASWLSAALLIASSAIPAGAAAGSDRAFQIFLKARDFWANQRYPAITSYDVAVRIDEGSIPRVERYVSYYDAVHDRVHVDPVSDYEAAHPASGKGVDLFFFGVVRLTKPQPPIDFLGVPVLAPMYDFGMSHGAPRVRLTEEQMSPAQLVAQIRQDFHDPARAPSADPAAANPSPGLREIASVNAFERDYAVALDGEETIDGHDCYKLQLDPLRDPQRFRLRELWIDKTTSATWKLRAALNFTYGPGTTGPWDVTFASIDNAQYVKTETALTPMAYRGLIYRHADVTFENVQAVEPPRFWPGSMWNAPLVMREPE